MPRQRQSEQNILLDPFIELVDIIDDDEVNKLQTMALKEHKLAHEIPESGISSGKLTKNSLATSVSKEIILKLRNLLSEKREYCKSKMFSTKSASEQNLHLKLS